MLLGFTLALALSPGAHAEGPKIQRSQFYCLSNVAKLGSDLLRPVPSKEGRPFVLAKVNHAGAQGYYLVDMGTGADSNISYLDGRILGALKNAEVKESLPAELLKVLQGDAKGKTKAVAEGEAAKLARPTPVNNENSYAALSENVLAVLKAQPAAAKSAVPEDCHSFGDLVGQLTDQTWAATAATPAPEAPPAKSAPAKGAVPKK